MISRLLKNNLKKNFFSLTRIRFQSRCVQNRIKRYWQKSNIINLRTGLVKLTGKKITRKPTIFHINGGLSVPERSCATALPTLPFTHATLAHKPVRFFLPENRKRLSNALLDFNEPIQPKSVKISFYPCRIDLIMIKL